MEAQLWLGVGGRIGAFRAALEHHVFVVYLVGKYVRIIADQVLDNCLLGRLFHLTLWSFCAYPCPSSSLCVYAGYGDLSPKSNGTQLFLSPQALGCAPDHMTFTWWLLCPIALAFSLGPDFPLPRIYECFQSLSDIISNSKNLKM